MGLSETDLDSYETGTVRRRTKTIVTPKMAMESFRLSFLNDDQDVNFDAILGELYELESQLNTTQSELSRNLTTPHGVPLAPPACQVPPPPAGFGDCDEGAEVVGNEQIDNEELDQLAAQITEDYTYNKPNGQPLMPLSAHYSHHHLHPHLQPHHPHHPHHHLTVSPGGGGGSGSDGGETDSAFSDNTSLPSSESYTSMATVSSSTDTQSSSSGETCGIQQHAEEEQQARKEKIRIALDKIKDAKIRKLFVRAFAKDGSSKSILVDEKMSVGQVCSQLADKNHVRLNHTLAVVEHMPELLMERILEDHDSLVENMVMWTKDSKNKVVFEDRMDKYDLFRNPEKYLLSSTVKSGPLTPVQKDKLIQDFFSPDSSCAPQMEGALYLKSDGKKAWKKFFFVLRASGLYYNPKGKASKNPKDLLCLVQFDFVEVYRGLGWKKKYHAPTDCCFALKHPQIQKKTSKYIRYFCADSDYALDQWVMGIRTVKLGKQMLHNYERLTHEVSMWDMRQTDTGGGLTPDHSLCQMLNQADLSDSRMSVPEPGSRHSVIQVHNSGSLRNSANMSDARDAISIEVLAIPSGRKTSDSGAGSDGRSLSGSLGSSSLSSAASESSHKTPVKRVSFSATHTLIHGDSSEQIIKHRDSIISASTDSSEDSSSSGGSIGSGDNRLGSSFRGKMRPKLPLSTETTRNLAEMCNVNTVDETPEAIYAETPHSRAVTAGNTSNFTRGDRRRSSMQERRGSITSDGSNNSHRLSQRGPPMSPPVKQHSFENGTNDRKTNIQGHVRRRSDSLVGNLIENGDTESNYGQNSLYSAVYSPACDNMTSQPQDNQTRDIEPLYNQICSPNSTLKRPKSKQSSVPPQYYKEMNGSSTHEPSPPPLPPPLDSDLPPPPLTLSQEISAQIPFLANTNKESLYGTIRPAPVPKESVYGTIPSTSTPKEAMYGTISSTQSSKNPPPPTLPKPNNSHNLPPPPVLAMSQGPPPPPSQMSQQMPPLAQKFPPPPKVMSQPPPPPPIAQSQIPPPPSQMSQVPPPPSVTSSLPKHPPAPIRLPSNDSVSGTESTNSSPQHIAMPPPMAPINPIKLPPPTLPKTSMAASAMMNLKSPPPTAQNQTRKPGQGIYGDPKVKNKHAGLPNNTSSLPHAGRYGTPDRDDITGPPTSPSLPFLSELSRRTSSESSNGSGSGVELRNGHASNSPNSQHRRSASAGGMAKGDRKAPPPPPPKRSDTTRLSGDITTPASPTIDSLSNGSSSPLIANPIYENFDGMLNIDELPPPPPELLMGLTQSEIELQRTSGKKPKPPPPPPKRSKDTQLSSY